MTTVQKLWMIFIMILILDFDLSMIVYGNRLVSMIGLLVLFLMLVFVIAFVLRGV